jgi:hypothetical protein
MSKVSVSGFMALCVALAACSDSSVSPAVTSPNSRAALSEASADYAVSYIDDGSVDVNLALETAAQSAQLAASAQTIVNRASGHVGFNSGLPIGLASEQYSFVALNSATGTKGEYEMTLTTVAGRQNKVHGNVICMNTVGNTTTIAGIITALWVNNVPTPIPAAPTHNVWTVVDNGEGQGTVDSASPMGYSIAPGAAFHCTTGISQPMFPIQQGEIQVR